MPKQMTAAECKELHPNNNWTPEVNKGGAYILIGYDGPPVPIAHLLLVLSIPLKYMDSMVI
jgi:hypothetical protein